MADTFPEQNVSASLARRLIEAGAARGAELGKAFTIAIVDASGVLKALERMDGAPLISVQIAQDKAYTAVGFGIPTAAWHDFIKDDPPLAAGATAGIDRLVIFGGGFPITVGGEHGRRDRRERRPLLGRLRRRRSRAARGGLSRAPNERRRNGEEAEAVIHERAE